MSVPTMYKLNYTPIMVNSYAHPQYRLTYTLTIAYKLGTLYDADRSSKTVHIRR